MDGKRVVLTVTNHSMDAAREAEIVVRGAAVQSANVVTLVAADVHAHNTFEAPRAVEPKEQAATVRGGALVHRFPAGSVTKLEVML